MTLKNKRANGNACVLGGSLEGPIDICDNELRLRLISMNVCFFFSHPVLFSCLNVSIKEG